ncbi:MAG TPA: MAPEG family protein [Candidatus Kapabacteria bacterium]|nr:MAPEG family protein [Candidatus Kapabacteria bacterium]
MVLLTAYYASLMAIILVYLAVRVTLCRRRFQIGLGDGGNQELSVLIRAHANALENIPFTLVLMLLAELNGLAPAYLHAAGIALLVSRLAHAYGFIVARGAYARARAFGILVNWILLLALAFANVGLVYAQY